MKKMRRRQGMLFLLALSLIFLLSPRTSRAERAMPEVIRPTVEFVWGSGLSDSPDAEIGTAGDREEFRRLLQEGFKALLPQFGIRYTGSDVQGLFDDFTNDKSGKYLYGTEYHHWVLKKVSLRAEGFEGNMEIRVQAEYHHTAAEENALNGMVDETLRKMISSGMSDLEKADAVHDYIVLMTEYRKDTSGSAHSPYTVMKERGGVCQGYATLGYKMLEKLGFDVRLVPGFAGEDHLWLKVKVDGEWYNMDITFDDPVPDRKNTVQYKYDLISDAKISSDHHQQPSLSLPSATSTKYDARSNRPEKVYTDAEVQALLNGGGNSPEPPTFDEVAYFNALGAVRLAQPITEKAGRDRFTIRFNEEIFSGGLSNISLLALNGDTVTTMSVKKEIDGNRVYLYAGHSLPSGTYYVLVGKQVYGTSGKQLKQSVYRKFVLNP